MDEEVIPGSLRWFMPIAEALANVSDDEEVSLDETHARMIQRWMSYSFFDDLEKWHESEGEDPSPESGDYELALIVLDEIEALPQSAMPPQDWGRVFARLDSYSHLIRVAALKAIGKDLLPEPGSPKRAALSEKLHRMLSGDPSDETRVWVDWLLCMIEQESEVYKGAIRRVISEAAESLPESAGGDRTLLDACEAILSLNPVQPSDVQLLEQLLITLGADTDRAAVVLSDMLHCDGIGGEYKRQLASRVIRRGNADLIEVVESASNLFR